MRRNKSDWILAACLALFAAYGVAGTIPYSTTFNPVTKAIDFTLNGKAVYSGISSGGTAFRAYTATPRAVIGQQATFAGVTTARLNASKIHIGTISPTGLLGYTGYMYQSGPAPYIYQQDPSATEYTPTSLWYSGPADNNFRIGNVTSGLSLNSIPGAATTIYNRLNTPIIFVDSYIYNPLMMGGSSVGSELTLTGTSATGGVVNIKGSAGDTAVIVRNGSVYGNFSGGTVKATSIPMLVSHEQNGSSHINGIYSFSSPLSSNGRSRAGIFKNYTGGAYINVVTVTGNMVGVGTASPLVGSVEVVNSTRTPQIAVRKSTDATGGGIFLSDGENNFVIGSGVSYNSGTYTSTASTRRGSVVATGGAGITFFNMSFATVGGTSSQLMSARFSPSATCIGSPKYCFTGTGRLAVGTSSPTSALHAVGLPVYGGATMTAARASITGLTRGAFWEYSTAGLRQLGVY